MPPEAFLMSGSAETFQLADQCPVTKGPHRGNPVAQSYLLADATVRDRSASVRIALWRCKPCGALLVGLGQTGPALDAPHGTGVHVQEFTWLEEIPVLLDPERNGHKITIEDE
jgi:hypothetical protein